MMVIIYQDVLDRCGDRNIIEQDPFGPRLLFKYHCPKPGSKGRGSVILSTKMFIIGDRCILKELLVDILIYIIPPAISVHACDQQINGINIQLMSIKKINYKLICFCLG